MRTVRGGAAQEYIAGRQGALNDAEAAVRPILDDVQARGDAALRDWGRKLDDLGDQPILVEANALAAARSETDSDTLAALSAAASHIRAFAAFQMPTERSFEISPGLEVGQIVRPLEAVGCYVPGGAYPLPSTLLMTVVPALVAGVETIVVANPRPVRETLAAADLLGVETFARIGGAQAIAAMAFGTEMVPKVDRIVGPGNRYVAAAKKLLSGEVAIDSVAGPSEVVIVSNDGDPEWIAADLLAQAEHDPDACSIFITENAELAEDVAASVARQLTLLPTSEVASRSIRGNGAILLAESRQEALEFINELAPEHLCLHDEGLLAGVKSAGSVFLGPYSVEALGDYATGPNHVLPTGGASKSRGGLSVSDYLKVITVQRASAQAVRDMAPIVTTLARLEGLEAHARSVEARL